MNLNRMQILRQKSSGFLILFLALFLSRPFLGFSQGKVILKPSDLVDLSIQNSKFLKISSEQVNAAKARLAQTKDNALPFVGVSGSYYQFAKPNVSLSSGLSNLLKGNNSGSSGGSGGSAPSVTNATLLQGTVSENLFSGFKNKYSIQADQFLVRASELKNEANQDEVVLNALSAFYNIYKLKSNQKILTEDLAEQNRRVHDFTNLEKNGLLTRNDLLKSEVGASNIKLNLSDINNALEIAQYNLKIMLGIPEANEIELDTTQIFKDRTIKSKEELMQMALDNRNDLKSIYQENESYKARIKSAKSAYYPSVTLSGGYIDAFIPGLLTVKNVLNAGIGVKYNFTNLFTTKHRLEESKANLNASQANYQYNSDQIKMGLNQAYLNYLESLKRIDLDQEIIEQASENYKILKNKYANSLATLTDLLDGELTLLQARLNQSNAKADAQIAYYNLIKSSGTPLTKELVNQ